MDTHSNLEYLCRVCAANTKGKNTVAECVYILKTAGLKDKLDKFLYLKISENDSLPKVLCKSCFRQVEATASLSKIAKHTQQVFRDFLLSNLPKGPVESTSSAEYTSSDFMGNRNDNERNAALTPALVSAAAQPIAPTLTTCPPPPLVQPLTAATRKDDVVVNVSVADPLTRDNQKKMISNSQRRQSMLVESRFTPKSIAQKPAKNSFAVPRPIAPKPTQQNETINMTNNSKAATPVINFYPVKTPQQTKPQMQLPQATQITTFSSGGYVIGRISASPNDKEEEPKKLSLPLTSSVDNILQQKRKNLVKALNNIKANNSGQVSLLKSSQQKQAEALQNNAKTPFNEVVNQTAEDELPDRIIIAAPKNKPTADKSKKEPLNLSSKIPAKITQLPPTTSVQQEQEDPSPSNDNLPKPAFPDDITLGRVIRDMDLLKLILKALKWPVNKQNMELQLQRLRNSKFTDIMSDSNLLQDTDLTQLLGPYLAPVLLAAHALQQQQQQQQQQSLNNPTVSSGQNLSTAVSTPPKMTALEAAQAEINKSIPYKLPPETSVQLVPATPEETERSQSPPVLTVTNSTSTSLSIKREKPKETKSAQKRQRRSATQRNRDSILISDEEEITNEGVAAKKSRQRPNKSAANVHFELNPNFISQFNMMNGSGGHEADELMALLLKQKNALLKDNRVQKRRRNSASNLISLPPSEFDALIDLDDDIVLMEPVSTTSSETSTSAPEQQQQKTDITNTFVVPAVPLITRPIIKRRKTVIHSPKNRFILPADIKEGTPSAPVSLLKSKDKLIDETINQVVAGNITNADITIQPSTSNTVAAAKPVVVTATELQPSKTTQQKKLQNKSSLGKQLLEAIGLQKLPSSKPINSIPNETPTSSTVPKSKPGLPTNKQSVQQIRSALKKSLKQAQEQQQQKQKELCSATTNTVIQDADSTTKPALKEVLVVEGKAEGKSDSCSSEVDVEEQIDKVTLMVRNNDEEASEETAQSSKNKTVHSNEKDERKEGKKSASNKIQERHRTVTNRNIEDKEKSNEDQQQPEQHGEKIETDIENGKLAKEVFISNKSNEPTAPSPDQIIVPKRRGRKRLLDKQLELEAAEAKEKDNKTAMASLTEKQLSLEKSAEEEPETTSIIKTEEETENNKTSGRPTRQSKTQSKYYKGPDKPAPGKRSLPSRTTRNRKYC